MLALFACGKSSDTADSGGGQKDLGMSGGGDLAQGGAPDLATNPHADLAGALNLTGTFATQIVNNQVFDSTLAGKGDVTITTLFLTNATQNGTTLDTQATTCDVSLTPYKTAIETVATTYPQAAINAIHPQANMISLGAAQVGDGYDFTVVQNIGWKPSGNPATEPLPTSPSDPQVTDDDMDGHPGVTLDVALTGLLKEMGQVYVCNRSIVTVSAKIESADKIAGSSSTTQQQEVLGANPTSLAGQQVTATPDTTKPSTFTMVRLTTPAQADCAYVIANAATLF